MFAFALALVTSPLAAQNNQRLLDVEAADYKLLDALFMEQGLAVPNSARPWSIQELRAELERIAPGNLSEAGLVAYRHLLTSFSFQETENNLAANISAIVSPEGFGRLHLGGYEQVAGESYPWLHGYEERSSFLELPLELWVGDGFYAVVNAELKEEHATVRDSANAFNIILDDPSARVDLYFPFKAYGSVGGPGWSLRFGRDSISWGNGQTGNMVLSDYSDFYDHAAVALFGPKLKFSSVYAVMDSFDPRTFADTTYAALMVHRLDIRAHDRLNLALTEAVTFGNMEPELLRDLNPFMIFHNWTIPERTNSLFSVEFNFTPWRWFETYGQVALDEFATKYETDNEGGGGPAVLGWLAGIRGVWPLGPGYIQAGIESATTSPWLYNRRAYPYFYNVRRYWSLAENRFEYIVKPLGYEYGPDAVIWSGKTSWISPGGPSVNMDILLLTKGETDIDDAWAPAADDAAPSGEYPESTLAIQLDTTFPVLSWLDVGAGLTYAARRNLNHQPDLQSDDLEFFARVQACFRNSP